MSLLVIFEIDLWIKNLKWLRFLATASGYVYNFVWLLFFVKFLDILQDWDGEKELMSKMFMAMVLSYNLILNACVLPINFAMALKEFSMEYF